MGEPKPFPIPPEESVPVPTMSELALLEPTPPDISFLPWEKDISLFSHHPVEASPFVEREWVDSPPPLPPSLPHFSFPKPSISPRKKKKKKKKRETPVTSPSPEKSKIEFGDD